MGAWRYRTQDDGRLCERLLGKAGRARYASSIRLLQLSVSFEEDHTTRANFTVARGKRRAAFPKRCKSGALRPVTQPCCCGTAWLKLLQVDGVCDRDIRGEEQRGH